jgi:hypothetical protein
LDVFVAHSDSIGLFKTPESVAQLFGCALLDVVAVALLGEEQLSLDSELLFLRIGSNYGIEMGFVVLGTEDATQSLGFLLSGPERP